MPDSAAAPPLPINSKNRPPAIDGLPGAGRKDRRKQTQEVPPNNKAWADYTPTPFESFGPTPWSTAHAMMGYGPGAFGPGMPGGFMPAAAGIQEGDKSSDSQAPEHPKGFHASPPAGPTPKVWPNTPTPTPGPQGAMPYGFGVPGMPMPMPMPGLPLQRPPDFSMFAEAARDAANSAAMAAAAAGSPETAGVPSPSEEAVSQAPPFNDDYTGDFDSPPTSGGAQGVQPGMVGMPPFVPGPLGMVAPPSRGSQFHGTGKCRPCAWFHKPQGCQSEQSCSYCHLCPEGELKSRKKLKVAAMRMGALTPAKPGKSWKEPGAARTLKLNPLL